MIDYIKDNKKLSEVNSGILSDLLQNVIFWGHRYNSYNLHESNLALNEVLNIIAPYIRDYKLTLPKLQISTDDFVENTITIDNSGEISEKRFLNTW